ncbi:MAG: hypothetical protein JWQ89_3939 [Devosia sp.]|uniref:HdeD family acid-resistance protein n=1 Tax=Devosia sp. TaxID=1871048 RepID=UPI002610D603|nr:HdeD family acid-resistance protein [Devosia sp.]MDB5542212.1 hypothetical protein [Devosia sp.]
MANAQTSAAGLPLGGGPLIRMLGDNWWLLLIRGIAAIAFGVLAFFWPGITLITLTLLWGAYMLVDGVFALWGAISGRGAGAMGHRWWLAIAGVISILAGLVAFFWPGLTTYVLLMFIAAWAIIIGLLTIWGAIQMRREIEGEWVLGLFGLLAIAFGLLLFFQPGAGALSLVWAIAWYAILAGILLIVLAFRVRRYKQPA